MNRELYPEQYTPPLVGRAVAVIARGGADLARGTVTEAWGVADCKIVEAHNG